MTQPKTNKGRFNEIIKQADKINNKLNALREECKKLVESCECFRDECDYDTYIYELQLLQQTTEDLQNFDFEDAIPEKAKYNF